MACRKSNAPDHSATRLRFWLQRSSRILRADSALLPIAYYLYGRGAQDDFLTHWATHGRPRYYPTLVSTILLEGIGYLGIGLDTLLTSLRDVIAQHGQSAFPHVEIEEEMTRRGKTLSFASDGTHDLVELEYGEPRTFALLSLIFDSVDTTKTLHVDHIFPYSLFKRRKLLAAGISEERVDEIIELANRLPNLQLMEGAINQEKLTTMPLEWLKTRESSPDRRDKYIFLHTSDGLPDSLSGFETFCSARSKGAKAQNYRAPWHLSAYYNKPREDPKDSKGRIEGLARRNKALS